METAMMSLREVYGCLEQEGKVQNDEKEKGKHLQTAAEQEMFQERQVLTGKR